MEKVEYPQIPWPPVVQISVETTPDRSVNPIRLGQEFHDVSANPKSMFKVVFKKEKQRWALSNGETESNGISPFASVHSSLLDLDPHSIDGKWKICATPRLAVNIVFYRFGTVEPAGAGEGGRVWRFASTSDDEGHGTAFG